MKKTLAALFALGFAFLLFAGCLGSFLKLEAGNQIYKLLAVFYLCIPGLVAYYFATKDQVSISLRNRRPLIVLAALLLPLFLLIVATLITFALSLEDATDSIMIAPMHGLTIKHKVLQIFSISSNFALLALFYALTLQLVIALGEEVMWRGYFLSLLEEVGFWRKSFVIGFVSGLWHVPLIVLFGWYYSEHMVLGPIWMILLSLLLSPILLYLRLTSGSLLAPLFFHAFFYSMASLLPFIFSEPNYLIGGMTGLAGFIALSLTNIALYPLYKKVDRENESLKEPS